MYKQTNKHKHFWYKAENVYLLPIESLNTFMQETKCYIYQDDIHKVSPDDSELKTCKTYNFGAR